MSRDRAKYLGGLVGCALCGLATLAGLYRFAPPRAADEQGPQRWLLLGGACVLPAALFYGWVMGSYLVGRVRR